MIQRLIIAGGRGKALTLAEYAKLDRLQPVAEVVSGGALGVDHCGALWAARNRIPCTVFRADWKKNGKAAGPMRNEAMAKYATDLAVFDGGLGTANMVKNAKKYGLTIHDFRTKTV